MRYHRAAPSDLIQSVSRALRVLEAVGCAPKGLTVKQVARRCELTLATTYVNLGKAALARDGSPAAALEYFERALAASPGDAEAARQRDWARAYQEGDLTRREDGTYVVGFEVADRFRELAAALAGPPTVDHGLRRAVADTGYSHYIGRWVAGRVAITSVVEGGRSPRTEDLIVGFDEGAHATALGKGLLAAMSSEQRAGYLQDNGMRPYTSHTLVDQAALAHDLAAGDRRGMYVEVGQYRPGVACVSAVVAQEREPESRVVVACTMPAAEFLSSAQRVRTRLAASAASLATALGHEDPDQPGT